jgi:hypothetical protein
MTTQEMTMDVTEAQPHTWALSYGEYVATVEKIAKINERAQKRGFTGRLEVISERVEVTEVNPLTQMETTTVVYKTRVTGEAPSYGGYTFLARIDRVGESFVISTAPGVEHVERSLVHVGECDHCGQARRRNNTYLVRNDETGQTVNVGSTCIKDFLGWDAGVVFFSDSDMEPADGGTYFAPVFTVDTVLAYAYAAIKAHGWTPRSAWGGMPTADLVGMALLGGRLTEKERMQVEALRAHAAEAGEMVATVRAYITSDDFNGTSTYVENLKALMAVDAVTSKQFGLLASAPQAYLRSLEKAAEKKAQVAKTAGSEWVGAEKERITVKGTIEAIRYSENTFGYTTTTTTIYTILSEEGNLFTWFSSNGALGDEAGVAVNLVGTVKKHEEFNGSKRTVITRCKAI